MHMQDGIVRNNCFNNTFNLKEHFEVKGLDKSTPLYIASSWKETSAQIVKKVNMGFRHVQIHSSRFSQCIMHQWTCIPACLDEAK